LVRTYNRLGRAPPRRTFSTTPTRWGISPISAPAAGPFPPQISPEGIPRARPTQLGPAPAAALPGGGLKKNAAPRQTTEGRGAGGGRVGGSQQSNTSRSFAIYRSRQTTCDDRTTQCPLATGFPRPFGPKGKHSFHQALTSYLTNDPMFCSESTN
jgi:hypothetical protein